MEYFEHKKLSELKKDHNVISIEDNSLYVIDDATDGRKTLVFLEVRSSSPLIVDYLFSIEGYSSVLREGRHSFFGKDGYIFYLNARNMIKCLEYCGKYFDMD